jgi:Holliday junction resolvase RusA-like endonuclease
VTVILVTFDVVGHPAPQGNKTPIVRNGHAVVVEGKGAGRQRHRDWRAAVADAARTAAGDLDDTPVDGPLHLEVFFRFPMPASRPKKIRAAGVAWKTTAPDGEKLMRAVCDGLQAGGLIHDDARIVIGTWRKIETLAWTGATIRLFRPAGVG